MAASDFAGVPVGAEWLVDAVPVARNSIAPVLNSSLAAVRQIPHQGEAATEKKNMLFWGQGLQKDFQSNMITVDRKTEAWRMATHKWNVLFFQTGVSLISITKTSYHI